MPRSQRKRKQTSFFADEQAETSKQEKKEGKRRKMKNGKSLAKTVISVAKQIQPIPKKNKYGELVFKDHKEFYPNLTPAEVLQRGSFGGTYWRPIYSSVIGERLSGQWKEFPKEWFEGLTPKEHFTRSWDNYSKSVNRYGVKCGGDLEMWESSGWISSIDPYGWFQWYCRFYLGRRCDDDERQIKRWRGVTSEKGRFRNQLIGRIARAGATVDDPSISPVIRQALQHWGYVLTQRDADKYVKLKGLPPLKR
eukprot:g1203.t1